MATEVGSPSSRSNKSKRSGRGHNNNNLDVDEKDNGGGGGGKRNKEVFDTLTRKDRREFREAFQLFDKDDDGTITISELHEVFLGLNYHFTESQLNQMINTIDDNGDGKIDLEEFILMMRGDIYNDPANMKPYIEELKDAFDVFDKDGNGSISVPELQATMEALGENLTRDDIFAMIGEVDNDGDGNIDFEEFARMMKQDHLLFDLKRDQNKITKSDITSPSGTNNTLTFPNGNSNSNSNPRSRRRYEQNSDGDDDEEDDEKFD